LNVVSKFFSLVIALSSAILAASVSAASWWQVPSQWPLTQPLQHLDSQAQQGWQLLQCQQPDAIQVWLPTQAAGMGSLLHRFADWPLHPMARFAPCFQLRFYQPQQVQCELQGQRQRLSCTMALLPVELQQAHIVFADQGIASAAGDHHINLPLSASMNLLAHELAHWFGLADEYPLQGQIAADFCGGYYDHPSLNVAVTATEHMTSAQLEAMWHQLPWHFAVAHWQQLGQPLGDDQWQLGSVSNSIGLHAIDSCKAVGKFAWRPVDHFTAMHYIDSYAWPELYLELIKRELKQQAQ